MRPACGAGSLGGRDQSQANARPAPRNSTAAVVSAMSVRRERAGMVSAACVCRLGAFTALTCESCV